jgi:CBS domain containing-hemolysin-like protein
MSGLLPYLGALVLFLIGLRLAAFFSGAETGFYRASYLRLSIDAQAGDPVAKRILWFCQNPTNFVVTALIGNNVAHYILTVAVGIAAVEAGLSEGMAAEVVATLLIAPFAFTFGELIPKNLYYRAPLWMLRRNVGWFTLFYRAFLPVSYPLIALTQNLQRFSRTVASRPGQILGRARLVQVLSQGHEEGLLLDVQRRLIEGMTHLAGQSVGSSIVPTSRILGVAENAAREDLLSFARRYGLTNVALRHSTAPDAWFAYVRVADVALTQRPLASLARSMPVIEATCSKLEALLTLRSQGAAYGVVKSGQQTMGIASDHGLSEQLFREPQAAGGRVTMAR